MEKFRGGPDGTGTNKVRKIVNNMLANYRESKAVSSIGAGGETAAQRTLLI